MEDRKPDPAASQDGDTKNNTITVRVRDQTGEETFFKVKKVTRMEKVFATYASRKGVSKEALRFLLDGDRINPEQTPDELGLEDQDMVSCADEGVRFGLRFVPVVATVAYNHPDVLRYFLTTNRAIEYPPETEVMPRGQELKDELDRMRKEQQELLKLYEAKKGGAGREES